MSSGLHREEVCQQRSNFLQVPFCNIFAYLLINLFVLYLLFGFAYLHMSLFIYFYHLEISSLLNWLVGFGNQLNTLDLFIWSS